MKQKIIKSKVIEQWAIANGITESESERYLNNLIRFIYKSVKEGKEVDISGFGKFSSHKRKGRYGVNPRTLKPAWQESRLTPKFVAGATFRSILNPK